MMNSVKNLPCLSVNYTYALKLRMYLERCGQRANLNQYITLVCTLLIPKNVTL